MADTVLFLHAFPLCRDMWREQIEVLEAAGKRTVAHNLPGFGGEEGAISSLPETAEWILERVPTGPLDAIGLSMGGYLLMELLRQDPLRFDRVVLADTTARADTSERVAQREEQARRALTEGVGFLIADASQTHPPLTAQRASKMIYQASREGVAGALHAMAARVDSRKDLPKLGERAIVIVGENDTVTPPDTARELAKALGSPLHVLPNAGHLSNLDAAEAFNDVLLNFLT
ncbi:alpha/beta fold hydrolase [Deinococcus yavapaiensis]|uniref:Pimeloyl-ACP methyl ester carboxylesterase n=1 Tax=Deinococcus yavapaiensis KR-236 TaxID=694435 RepID=A0A318SGE8_9DEIO|nr:alpha/beta hydrolase [Deinococcus yavapaiensis]PYE48980.1 pimeloyl-ACP methyl ester carboxylesterase [Deinococcus yavapaiensis KR-236]